MDLSPFVFQARPTMKQRGILSALLGVAVLALAYAVDSIQEQMDFSFWLFLCGCISFSGGFILLEPPRSLVRSDLFWHIPHTNHFLRSP